MTKALMINSITKAINLIKKEVLTREIVMGRVPEIRVLEGPSMHRGIWIECKSNKVVVLHI